MFRPRIIPVLLIRNKGLVKTIKFNKTTYIGDPINAVRLFNELKADELVFLDIDASKQNYTISEKLVKKIGKEAYMPFSVGGGIKRADDAKKLIAAGAEKIIINTFAQKNPKLITEISNQLGSQSVIVSIDAKKNIIGRYKTVIYGGSKSQNISPAESAKIMEKAGAGEIIINSINQDGAINGYDIDLIKDVAEKVNIPVIALGGAGNYNDFAKAINSGKASAVAAGSMFVYYGPHKAVLINYPSFKEKRKNFKQL